ncbi:hypothetical protein AYO20_10360 [Fonsecaea nubica]|uniref:Uncharacterized protein n=1 Tax=Fonsecaea nubica TaxID=856822 RepID=A0A178C9S5_9EURO|nr:hypothetical protein AYO20_10360 [Fonsecaea nubica]OAL25805.1 hypothetical protein AYO20_10360 [Fonsecaea nubica]
MPRLGGRDLIPLSPTGWVYGGGGGFYYGDEDDDYDSGDDILSPLPPRRPPGVTIPRQPVRSTARDIPLPDSYPYPPTPFPLPTRFPEPPRGSAQHKQSMKFTPWILNLTSKTHKCADVNLFRLPRPVTREEASRGGQRQQDPQNRRRRGTVVLPILPGPKRRVEFDVSVMTLSNVLYTPGARFSELSWKVLERQGFTRHVLHHDHMHDVTQLSPPTLTPTTQPRQPPPRHGHGHGQRTRPPHHRPVTAVEIGWRGIRRVEPSRPPPSRRGYPDPRGAPALGRPNAYGRCGPSAKESSVIRHRGVPGVDVLWVGYDRTVDPRHLHVHMTGADMVDVRLWSWGVEMGVVGKSAVFGGWVGWIGPNGGSAAGAGETGREGVENRGREQEGDGDDEDLFRKIVQGGLRAGEELGVV